MSQCDIPSTEATLFLLPLVKSCIIPNYKKPEKNNTNKRNKPNKPIFMLNHRNSTTSWPARAHPLSLRISLLVNNACLTFIFHSCTFCLFPLHLTILKYQNSFQSYLLYNFCDTDSADNYLLHIFDPAAQGHGLDSYLIAPIQRMYALSPNKPHKLATLIT